MSLRIICSGFLLRHPLGGHSWHHLQYLIGLRRLGHRVVYFEHYGWPDSCFDPERGVMSSDPSYGVRYLESVAAVHDFGPWCYLAQDGTAHGMTRAALARECKDADLYLNLSNINWIPEVEQCKRLALVDTDPVFTQIGAHGLGGPFSRYHALFTYGENVGQPGCDMPTAGFRWIPTRQPVVLDLWTSNGEPSRGFTTVLNWSPLGDCIHEGRIYGQKEREFPPYVDLPKSVAAPMELAVRVPEEVEPEIRAGGWSLVEPQAVTKDPWTYQAYLRSSRGEFSVAKHGFVVTSCGWFSERSAAYLASGRPVVIQDTGFSRWLDTGTGVVAFRSFEEARDGLADVLARYHVHRRAARERAVEYFDARKVLTRLIEDAVA
jgi:hypothetical protein